MRIIGIVVLFVGACGLAACSSGGTSTSTNTAVLGTVTATASALPATAAAATPAPDASAADSAFPQRCTQLVSNADVDALALRQLQLVTDSVVAVSGSTSQLVCRFQGTGAVADTAVIVVATGYPEAATANNEEANLRIAAQAQGGTFTKIDGISEEAYAFTYPTVTGVAARKGRRSVSVGIGKLLGVPAPAEFTTIIQGLLNKTGN